MKRWPAVVLRHVTNLPQTADEIADAMGVVDEPWPLEVLKGLIELQYLGAVSRRDTAWTLVEPSRNA